MAEALAARAQRLQREVSTHKRAINYHRRALAGAAAELAECEAACRQFGIKLVVHQSPTADGEGVIHGRDDRPTS